MENNVFLDYRAVNSDVPFYDFKTNPVLNQHAKEKHQKYDHTIEDNIRGSFTPMVVLFMMSSSKSYIEWLMH